MSEKINWEKLNEEFHTKGRDMMEIYLPFIGYQYLFKKKKEALSLREGENLCYAAYESIHFM